MDNLANPGRQEGSTGFIARALTFMGISPLEFDGMRSRCERARSGSVPLQSDTANAGPDREAALHEFIIDYCYTKWPPWKTLHCRMDKKSTMEPGSPDFAILMPSGKFLLIGCKRPGEKPTAEQLAWHEQARLLGHTVHVVHTEQEFLEILGTKPAIVSP